MESGAHSGESWTGALWVWGIWAVLMVFYHRRTLQRLRLVWPLHLRPEVASAESMQHYSLRCPHCPLNAYLRWGRGLGGGEGFRAPHHHLASLSSWLFERSLPIGGLAAWVWAAEGELAPELETARLRVPLMTTDFAFVGGGWGGLHGYASLIVVCGDAPRSIAF